MLKGRAKIKNTGSGAKLHLFKSRFCLYLLAVLLPLTSKVFNLSEFFINKIDLIIVIIYGVLMEINICKLLKIVLGIYLSLLEFLLNSL